MTKDDSRDGAYFAECEATLDVDGRHIKCTRPVAHTLGHSNQYEHRTWNDGATEAMPIEQLEMTVQNLGQPPGREVLQEGREHLTISGTFQSDKYPWCHAGFLPIKISDPMAYDFLKYYALARKDIDSEFCRDLLEAVRNLEDK